MNDGSRTSARLDMLRLNQRLAAARTDHERTAFERQIEATDRQIDQLVYELYGLTDQEIALIEKSTSEPKAALGKPGG